MVEVELLSVPGCPHVEAAHRLLEGCIEELKVRAHVDEKVGAYPSPTIETERTSWDRHCIPRLLAASMSPLGIECWLP
jgi:hypothetical protein